MGTGNPLVRSFDDDRINVTTFFIESEILDIEEVIAEYAANHDGDEISTESAYQQISDDDFESFEQMLCVDGLEVHGWDDAERISELSAEFRGEGLVIATGDNIYIVVPSGCDHYHIGFGFVPNRSWDSFLEEAHDENTHKRQWYEARDLDFDAKMDDVADAEYDSYIKKCNKEIKKIAASIAEGWGNEAFNKTFRVRDCAWTSSRINKTEFKRLALI